MTQYGSEHEEHLGLGLYRFIYDSGDAEYNWYGPGWSEGTVEWITWSCCIAIVLLTAALIVRRLRGARFLPSMALPIAAAAFTIGIMHAIADDGDGDISGLRSIYTMPAFTLYCCWLPLRSHAKRALWWLVDCTVLIVVALSFYAANIQFDLRGPVWFLPWLALWLTVRYSARGGRLATPAGQQTWRFLVAVHAIALSTPAIGLLMGSVFDEGFVFSVALFSLPAFSLSMSVFLLALFQMSDKRIQLA